MTIWQIAHFSCNIYFMQAWPCSWDVDFKLAAPRNTVVSGKLVNGVLKDLEVTPSERRSSVRVLPCQNVTGLWTSLSHSATLSKCNSGLNIFESFIEIHSCEIIMKWNKTVFCLSLWARHFITVHLKLNSDPRIYSKKPWLRPNYVWLFDWCIN